MSPPSSKPKNGGNTSGPRQIRFVATDGQPQTKRRRVNAAYVKRAPCYVSIEPAEMLTGL
jgi:hypothetical protein